MIAKLWRYRVRRWVLVIAACLAVGAGVIFARYAELHDAHWLWIIVPLAIHFVYFWRNVTCKLARQPIGNSVYSAGDAFGANCRACWYVAARAGWMVRLASKLAYDVYS